MVKWKQDILDRAGAPFAEEALFNKAWDQFNTAEQTRFVSIPSRFEKEFLEALISQAEFKINPSMRDPLPSTPAKRGCLHAEYGHADWQFFYQPVMEKYHITHTMAPMPVEERRARCQDVLDFCKDYDPAAVNAVLYGYDIDTLVPRELGGGVKNKYDYQECIRYVDYWFTAAKPDTQVVRQFRGPYACFSNFSACKVTLDGMEFPTVENAFQAAKTLREWERHQFQSCPPVDAKRLGYKVKLRDNWDGVKASVMLALLKQKFRPGTREYDVLMSTKGMLICEGNTWHDNFWGACHCAKCIGLPHQNQLGKLLMLIRDGYKYDVDTAMQIAVKDRFALIFPEDWEEALKSTDLCKAIYQRYPCAGLLVQHDTPISLYHLTSPDAADAIISDGFHVSGNPEDGTYGGDVVYAYESLSTFRTIKGSVPLKVKVSKYMRASAGFEKDADLEHECIFFPKDVLSVARVRL